MNYFSASTVISFFIALVIFGGFIILLRAILSGKFKAIYHQKLADLKIEINKEKALEKGYRPYPFESGDITIYAKNMREAKAHYRAHLRVTQKVKK